MAHAPSRRPALKLSLAQRAEREQGRALDNLYFSRIAQARLEWRLNNVSGVAQLLNKCDQDRRGWEWQYLRNTSQSEILGIDLPELSYIFGVVFSPDGSIFAFTGFNPYDHFHERSPSIVEIWDTKNQRRLHALEGPVHTMRLSFNNDGQRLAASGSQQTKIWDTANGRLVREWHPEGSVTFSPDGRILAAGGHKEAIFWDVESGAEVRRFPKSRGRVSYSPNGEVLAVSAPSAVTLHDAATGREIVSLPHGSSEDEARIERFFDSEGPELAFSPDGKQIVVATRPPRIWDTTTGRPLHQLSGHAGSVPGVAFSPDGRQAATAGVDSTIRLWDVQTGAERAVLRGHSALVGCLAFHPDGWCLLSGGRHFAQVKLWDLTRSQEHISLSEGHAPAFAFDDNGDQLSLVTNLGRLQSRTIASGLTKVGPHVDLTTQWLTPAALRRILSWRSPPRSRSVEPTARKGLRCENRLRVNRPERPVCAGHFCFPQRRW